MRPFEHGQEIVLHNRFGSENEAEEIPLRSSGKVDSVIQPDGRLWCLFKDKEYFLLPENIRLVVDIIAPNTETGRVYCCVSGVPYEQGLRAGAQLRFVGTPNGATQAEGVGEVLGVWFGRLRDLPEGLTDIEVRASLRDSTARESFTSEKEGAWSPDDLVSAVLFTRWR